MITTTTFTNYDDGDGSGYGDDHGNFLICDDALVALQHISP